MNFDKWLDSMVYTKNNNIAQEQLRIKSKQYIDALSKWDKFLLFHHTLRSSFINKLLKTGIYDGYEAGVRWAREFLNHIDENRLTGDPHAYFYFNLGSNEVRTLLYSHLKYTTVRYMMYLYITQLQTILLSAPILDKDVYVYKSTQGTYPTLPKDIKCDDNYQLQCKSVSVKQNTFNSTTMNRLFNFSKFYDKASSCCYFIIYIAKGNRILHISNHIHGFPYQDEVLLPFGAHFNFIHGETGTQRINLPRRMDIQKRPFTMGPVTIIDPDIKVVKSVDITVKKYIATYTKPTGIDCINTLKGIGNCKLGNEIFMYNYDNLGYLSGKFNNILPTIVTDFRHIPSFLSFATPEDIVIFEFENILGVPVSKAFETGIIKYNQSIDINALIPSPAIHILKGLNLRMITLANMESDKIPKISEIFTKNVVNIVTIGTILPTGQNVGYKNAVDYVIKTYGKPKRLFYFGSSDISVNGLDVYNFRVNILEESIKSVPENIRIENIKSYVKKI